MENDVLDALEELGYSDSVNDTDVLLKAAADGPSSVPFTQLVEWLVQQIADLTGLDERVHAINDSSESDSQNFLLEVSGFLREYGCANSALTEGPVGDRLNTGNKCLQLLDFLTSELQAVRIIAKKKPDMLLPSGTADIIPKQAESEVASSMKKMFVGLGFPKPPDNITATQLFEKLEVKVKELVAKYPNQIGKPLLKTNLSDDQWNSLLEIIETLSQEYEVRREMLLKRLDVTIQSFACSEKAKHNQDSIAKVYQPLRQTLQAKRQIGIPDILAARDELTRIQKTSTGDSRNACDINKVIIGRVPDRGGRAWELEPPPPEMPGFMKRNNAPRGHGPYGGYGGRGRGGGDFHRGGGGGFRGRGGRGGRGGGGKW